MIMAPLPDQEPSAEPEDEPLPSQPPPRPTFLGRLIDLLGRYSLGGSLTGVGLLILFHLVGIAAWIGTDTRPPTANAALHLDIALDYSKAVSEGKWGELLDRDFKAPTPPFPPLYHLSILHAMDAKDPVRAALWTNWLYLALLCVSLWGLARRFDGNWAGLGAAILFSCAAEVQILARTPGVDLALTAWVAAAYWALAASTSFQRRVPALVFGVLFAVCMLTKWSAFIYLLPALFIAAAALGDPKGRVGALLSGLVAVALMLPWYRAQWPPLLPRLLEAASQTGGEATGPFFYLKAMGLGLELPLFLWSLLALVVAGILERHRGRGVLVGWFLCSLFFWSFLSHRELRYLMPGLAPLAVLAVGLTGLRPIAAALCVFQLFSAANFARGWIDGGISGGAVPVSVLRTHPPMRDDWSIPGVLEEVESRRRTDRQHDNLTVVPRHRFLNETTFKWERRRLGLDRVRIRRPIPSRAEFSNFIFMKSRSGDVSDVIEVELNPFGDMTVKGKKVEDTKKPVEARSWFKRGYQALKRWKLPDETEGVLYWRRRIHKNPFREQKALFDYYEEGPLIVKGMTVDLGEWDPTRGVHPAVKIRAPYLKFYDLEAKDVLLVMEDLTLLPLKERGIAQTATKDLLLNCRFHHMRRLRILGGSVSEEDAEVFISSRMAKKASTDVRLDGNQVHVKTKFLNVIPVTARATAELSENGRGLDLELQEARVAGVRVPLGLLLGRHIHQTLAFDLKLPFDVQVGALDVSGGRVTITPGKTGPGDALSGLRRRISEHAGQRKPRRAGRRKGRRKRR